MENAPQSKTTSIDRIIIWTCPRCISTAFERAFIERDDCYVLHEPFGIPFYYGKEAKTTR